MIDNPYDGARQCVEIPPAVAHYLNLLLQVDEGEHAGGEIVSAAKDILESVLAYVPESQIGLADDADIENVIAATKSEIAADIAAGYLPSDVKTWTDLQRWTDANTYGGMTEQFFWFTGGDVQRVVDAVETWLSSRKAGRA